MLLAIMRKTAMLLLAVIGFTAFTKAQSVSGTVTDSKGDPIPGISIVVKGTTKGTSTDTKGVFNLAGVTNGATLLFTGTGFAAQSVKVSGSVINITMTTSAANLNEVVVVGYGTRKVKDLTGSVAALSEKDFNKGVIATPEQLIQGRTPGVIVTPSSGEPGAAATITIRGSASIRGNQAPLYVIDGVPISDGGTVGSAAGVEGSTTPKNPLAFLNPADIESITILKDASSAAIYGSRGANGVILVTTKNARSKRGTFTFSASTSMAKPASRYDLLNPSDFLAAVKKANIDAGTSPADAAVAVAQVDKGYNTDWQDEIFRTAVSNNLNLSWGINKNGTNVRLSGSYDKQEGIIKNSDLKRLTARANASKKFLKDKLKLEAAITVSNTKSSYAPNTNNAGYQGSLVGAAITFNPTFPVYNKDGSFYDPKDGNRNPAEMLAYFDDQDNNNRFLTSLNASYEIKKGLVWKTTLGYDKAKSERTSFSDPRLGSNAFGGTTSVFGVDYGNGIFGNGRTTRQNLDLKSLLLEHSLSYDKTFKQFHTVNAVLGYAYQSTESDYAGRFGWGLNSPVVNAGDVFVKDFNNFKNYRDFIPGYSKVELQSYFGRVNYSYKDKYYVTGTVRIDGSSKFGKDNRYGTFPAFAVKWNVLNESFGASLAKLFSNLSIRANYGVLGSQDGIGPYDALYRQTTWWTDAANTTKATSTDFYGNDKLKWEEAATTGLGVDFALWKNRIAVTVDYFNTKRKNLIFFAPTPGGFAPSAYYWINLPGYVNNKGWEFSFDIKAVETKKFKWSVNYNMTTVKNEVKELKQIVNTGAVSGQGLTGAYAQTIQDGYSLFSWKMPEYLGLDGNGNARYADGANDKIMGNALPTFFAGLTNNFSLGRWSLSVFANTTRGFYVYNNTANALFLKGSIKTAHNVTYAVANSNENPINPGSVSTRFLEKGDFIRISNANLNYQFNMKSKTIRTLSAFISGQNLALFTDYSGLDPEVNVDKSINGIPSRGFDYAGYPKARTFTLGVNVGF
ncbi:MAG: SusC/RagA family TonB-linked outer membrane protein [Ferruginibacter sp.]